MEVFTWKMSNILHFSTLAKNTQHSPKALKSKQHRLKLKFNTTKGWSMLLLGITAFFPSSLLHADDLADLIRQKSQYYSQPSSTGTYSAPATFSQPGTANFYQSYASAPNIKAEHIATLYRAEQMATMPSQQVLRTVRQMALDNKEIIQGSCWDYLNAAFNRAGVNKETVFKGEYPYGPFIDTSQIQPGDWLYYVNHSYNDVEHSGLFVGWLNRNTNEALILSYAGESRNEPARYKVYDVSHTYNVMRPSY